MLASLQTRFLLVLSWRLHIFQFLKVSIRVCHRGSDGTLPDLPACPQVTAAVAEYPPAI